MLNVHKPIGNAEGTVLIRYKDTQARLQIVENAGCEFISLGGGECEFRNIFSVINVT